MSKEIKTSAMDTLFEGLTGQSYSDGTNPSQDTGSHPETDIPSTKKAQKANYEVISTMVDPVIMSKIRAIASTEGLSIKDVIGVGLQMVVSRYEKVHGKVRVKKARKGDVGKVFNI